MPDFDIDFCMDRRNEIIDYVKQKYGKENVAQIITFGALWSKAAIRDIGRVLQLPYSTVTLTNASFQFTKSRFGEKIRKISRLPASNQMGTNTLLIWPTPSVSETRGTIFVEINFYKSFES